MTSPPTAQVLVIGSGAGGSVTALELATRGFDVLVLEEGRRHELTDYGASAPRAMAGLYRRRGMTPIVGRSPIGYVEGCCLGGSTEINSGFWHRTPREILLRWKAQNDLADADPEQLEPHFEWAERMIGVTRAARPWPKSSDVFAAGVEAMGWSWEEVSRAAPGCAGTNACPNGCPTGAKQGMSRSLIPRAEAAGARFLPGRRAKLLLKHGNRIEGVMASLTDEDGTEQTVRIDAEHIVVCAGPTETPVLLRRSGIKHHVGDSLRIHPMLKVVARFREEINAQDSVMPLIQVKEFWPEISLGGSFFTTGHLAMILGENWLVTADRMGDFKQMAAYYVAVKGTGKGMVRPTRWGEDRSLIRYELSREDLRNLSVGLARLSTMLLAAGAVEVLPAVHGLPSIRSEVEAMRWLDELLPRSALALTTVHAFSSCPLGERPERCAADSFGKIWGLDNLYVNDASMLPDSPGVNPQGSIMALARRNAIRLAETAGGGG